MENRKALLIGINYINTEFELNGCINDVKNVKKMLTRNCNFKDSNITMVTDQTDMKPTFTNILLLINGFVKNMKKGDTCYFHYSGHGTRVKDLNGDEKDGFDECLVPMDYSKNRKLILDDYLKKEFIDRVPSGVILYNVLDCCNSGTGLDLKYTVRNNKLGFSWSKGSKEDSYLVDIDNRQKSTKGYVIMLSGCKDDQTSSDVGKSGGALTLSFLNTMKCHKYKPRLLDLLKGCRDKVDNKYNSDQIPQLSMGRSTNLERRFLK